MRFSRLGEEATMRLLQVVVSGGERIFSKKSEVSVNFGTHNLNMHLNRSPLIEKCDLRMTNILHELAQVLYTTWEEAV